MYAIFYDDSPQNIYCNKQKKNQHKNANEKIWRRTTKKKTIQWLAVRTHTHTLYNKLIQLWNVATKMYQCDKHQRSEFSRKNFIVYIVMTLVTYLSQCDLYMLDFFLVFVFDRIPSEKRKKKHMISCWLVFFYTYYIEMKMNQFYTLFRVWWTYGFYKAALTFTSNIFLQFNR